MTNKEVLLLLIKHKARCAETADYLDCGRCPLANKHETCEASPYNRQIRYKDALKMYIEAYGKDPELMEVLL